ncbi:VOC family protein [Ornithinimicrobium cavernae]|uniref:VOC family protein n=1 Tax=Ornithinimicrobium cavernae TaxID=2666047 RepID=UPI000D6990DA|nr:VOC family protein [Ornithinimicrobium cavernae]
MPASGGAGPVVRFDHAVVGVRDLAGGRSALEAAGFTPAGGGVHTGRGTANELVRLRTGYLELLTVVDRTQALASGGSRRQAAEFLDSTPAGLLGFAMEVGDVVACQQRLAGAGVATSGPHAMARVQADGRRVSWRTVLIEDRQWLSPHPFLIEWDGEDDRWAGASATHPNRADRVRGVVVGSTDVDASVAVYRALGARDVVPAGDGTTLRLADITVDIREAPPGTEGPGRLLGVALDGQPDGELARRLRAGVLGTWFSV